MEHVKIALQLKVCAVFLLSPCGLSILCYLQTLETPKTAQIQIRPPKCSLQGVTSQSFLKNIAGRANIADRAT